MTQAPTEDQSARAILEGFLARYGLQGLGTTVWDWYTKEARPIEQILLDLRQLPEYKTRFPAMETLAQKGQAISESQYIEFETQAAQLWHGAGLPVEQIEEGDLITKWLTRDVSLNEVSHRIQDLYVRVANTAPQVRSWYEQQFGIAGDAMLAASFADPESAVPVLERRAAAAEFGGAGARFGYDIGLTRGLEAAGIGVTAAAAQQGFEQLQGLNPLFVETISENTDLTAEGVGLDTVFGLGSPTSRRELERRAQERAAAVAGSTAGGLKTDRGLGVGASRANRGR